MTEGFVVNLISPVKGLHPDPTHGQIPFYLLGTQHPPSLSICSFHQRMLGVACWHCPKGKGGSSVFSSSAALKNQKPGSKVGRPVGLSHAEREQHPGQSITVCPCGPSPLGPPRTPPGMRQLLPGAWCWPPSKLGNCRHFQGFFFISTSLGISRTTKNIHLLSTTYG